MDYNISIIVPTHNSAKYIERTLGSVLKQTIDLKNVEVVMVDDFSTDSTKEIIDNYADNYDNFVAVHLTENSGFPGKPRNIGMEMSRGEYIMFMDHDDLYTEDICEVLYSKIVTEDADVVSCRYMELHDDEKLIKSRDVFEDDVTEINVKNIDEENRLFLTPPSIWTKIFKKSFIMENNILFPEDTLAEDVTFMTQVYLKASRIIYLNNYFGYHYSIRDKEDKSTIFTRNKKLLMAMLKGYYNIYNIIKAESKEEYFALVCQHSLPFWASQFILSDIDVEDKKDLLNEADFIFKLYNKYGLEPSDKHLSLLSHLIINNQYEDAIMFSEIWRASVKNQYKLEDQLEQSENMSNSSDEIILDNSSESYSQIKNLVTDFYEMAYENNNNRSIYQRLISKFPSLYIILKNKGLIDSLIIIKGYKSIKKNHLFDFGYYLKNNDDVRKSGVDPLLNYIFHGYKEGRKPSPTFDGDYYQRTYQDIRNSKLNPLIHYSLYGLKDNKKPEIKNKQGKNKTLFIQKWDHYLFKEYYMDKLNNKKLLSNKPFKVAFVVTENGENASAGDYFTALEFGEGLKKLGWQISFLSQSGPKNWYEVDEDVDVLISLLDVYDPRRIKCLNKYLIKIAWPRNWFDRWASHPGFSDYDIVLASSKIGLEYIEENSDKKPSLLPIATNSTRFNGKSSQKKEYLSDYCFTGSYWNVQREIMEMLDPEKLPYKFNLYGKNWDKIDKFKNYYQGFISYSNLPEVYASTKIVVDDANIATKMYGAVNSRVFDALASGALILTNGEKGSKDTFNGKLPVFKSKEELTHLIDYYMSNEDERIAKIEELQKLVLKKHTYTNRANTLKEILEGYIQDIS
jgi:glycosyltransferase involved in cell wall biosynthesis